MKDRSQADVIHFTVKVNINGLDSKKINKRERGANKADIDDDATVLSTGYINLGSHMHSQYIILSEANKEDHGYLFFHKFCFG